MDKTRDVLEKFLKITIDELNIMDSDQQNEFTEMRAERKIVFNTEMDKRVRGRGNPLLSSRRYTSIEIIDKKIGELIK